MKSLRNLKFNNLSAIISVKDKPFKVSENDLIYTPRNNSLKLGDLLAFDRVFEISSKDFILQGHPLVSSEFYSIKGVVIEHPRSPPITTIRAGRKVQKRKVLGNYAAYTCILIKEISIKDNLLKEINQNPF